MNEALESRLAEMAGGPFWQFSLAFYGRDGVAETCLRLQDEQGLDVNLVLFCLWAGSRGQRLEAEHFALIAAEAATWQQEVVAPLRQVRRWLKGKGQGEASMQDALRQVIKEQELRAEAIEQERLAGHLVGQAGSADPAIAAANFRLYLQQQKKPQDEAIESMHNKLLEAFEAFFD